MTVHRASAKAGGKPIFIVGLVVLFLFALRLDTQESKLLQLIIVGRAFLSPTWTISDESNEIQITSRLTLKQEQWYTDMLSNVSDSCKHISHFFHHFLPHKQCNNMMRIGKCGDGSKLVCMDTFQGRNTIRAIKQGDKCVVYSFGSSEDSCFEADMANRTDCEIHIFDPTSNELKDERWTYHNYGLCGHDPTYTTFWNWRTQGLDNCTGCPMKNLKEIMNELGHDWIDVLKVDIDGAEWRSFEYIYDVMGSVPATQLQIEPTGLDITDLSDSLAKKTHGVYKLWENLLNDGFAVFHLEANAATCLSPGIDRSAFFEYSFMRTTQNLEKLSL